MVHVVAATFEDGVFKPDQQPSLTPHTRVRLLVETADEDGDKRTQAWAALEQLWRNPIDSHGQRSTRDQLHERH